MRKSISKIVSVLLTLVLCSTATPVFAGSIGSIANDPSVGADADQNARTQYGENASQADVYMTVDDGDIIVGVPTQVILSGQYDDNGKHIGKYSVSVSGDVSNDRLVQVKPRVSELTLTQNGKSSVDAVISQERTIFDSDDLANNISAMGTISADTLSAGSWQSSVPFEIRTLSKNDYDAVPNSKLLAENKDKKTYEDYDLFEFGRLTPSAIQVTDNPANDIITPDLLYLPYGSAVRFDVTKMQELGILGSLRPDMRMYLYEADGTYLKEATMEYFAPSEDNVDDDYCCTNFTVTDPDGIYVRFRWRKPSNIIVTDKTPDDLKSVFSVHSLTAINAEIFDNSTLTKCWENTDIYEAWTTKCIFFNPTDGLYWAIYPSQPSHTQYTGKILYRTSSDLVNWSEPMTIWNSDNEEFIASIDGAARAANGDIFVSLLADAPSGENRYTKTRFLRSTDNGKTWNIEHFVLNGEDADGVYRMQRPRMLEDGRIFSSYFDCNKKEKVGICYSEDGGKTWVSSDFSSKASLSDNGEYDFVKLNNGNILCAQRQNVDGIGISVTISTDNGKSFINETSLHFVDNNTQMINCPFIRYDKTNDRLTIYEIDRFKTGAICGIYTSGNNITDFLLNGAEFKGFFANACSLGINGNADMGYPHIIDAPDGTVKCFYYNRTNQQASTASWYSVSTK